MKRLYPYCRHSSKPQGKGTSRERQNDPWPAYCASKGLTLDTSFELYDDGVSAANEENATVGALGRFRDLVRQGRIPAGDALGMEDLDRFSRAGSWKASKVLHELVEQGIEIHSLDQPGPITKESLETIPTQIKVMLDFYRAHEENKRRAGAVREAYRIKREHLPEKRLTSVCPAWLKPKEGDTGFDPIPAKVAAVLRVYELAREGYGLDQLLAKLRREGVKPIGKGQDHWCRSYVGKLLNDRRVLGEYQPRTYRARKRVADCKLEPNYYPAIMSEADWLATRRAVELRATQKGPSAKRVASLFTGIIHDARDGRTMVIKDHGDSSGATYLLSSGAARRENDSPRFSFRYELIESWILRFLNKYLAVELLRDGPRGLNQQIADLTGQLADLDHDLVTLRKRFDTAANKDTILDMIEEREGKQKAVAAALEKVKQEQTNNHLETLGETRSIAARLRDAGPDELLDLRTRLKGRIRSLIREIWVLVEGWGPDRRATLQLFFRKGTWLSFTHYARASCPPSVALGGEEATLRPEHDLRVWRNRKRRTSFPLNKPARGYLTDKD
jgi:hypothetical protein